MTQGYDPSPWQPQQPQPPHQTQPQPAPSPGPTGYPQPAESPFATQPYQQQPYPQQPAPPQPGYQPEPGYPQPGYPQQSYQPSYGPEAGYPQAGWGAGPYPTTPYPGQPGPGVGPGGPGTPGGPGYPPPSGRGGNRGLIIAVVVVVVLLAGGITAFAIANSGGKSKAAPATSASLTTPPSPSTSVPPSTPTDFPSTSTAATDASPTGSASSSNPPAGTWADYSGFTDLIGKAQGDTVAAFKHAFCHLDGPLSVNGMQDEVVCDLSNPSVIFAVERFSSPADVQNYRNSLVSRQYSVRPWAIDKVSRGDELTAPASVDFLEILSTMCGAPTYAVDFWAKKTSTTLTTLHDQYWANAPFPNGTPKPC